MSKIKPRRADAREVLEGFGGIGDPGLSTGLATDMRNFRILESGSLEKRCGWAEWLSFSGEVRDVWQGTVGGVKETFVVAGECVFRVTDGTRSEVGLLTESTGRVCFAYYRERLYLLDDNEIYVWDGSYFRVANGYAPLLGRNWHPTQWGETNEPLNLFSRRLRVSYLNTVGTKTFVLPYYAASIDLLRVDNVTVKNFSFTAGSNQVTLNSVGNYVEIAFTMEVVLDSYLQIRRATRATVDRFGSREAMLVWGGTEGQNLYCSSRVDDNMLNYCRVSYPDTDPLYLAADGVVVVGDSKYPITALHRQHDRILAFHEMGASAVIPDPESDAVDSYALLRGVGCTSPIDVTLEGDPVIINEGGIFRLSSTAAEPDEFRLTRLSEGVHRQMLFSSMVWGAVACKEERHGELWFREVENQAGTVWVYRHAKRQWYCFDNIHADYFVCVDSELCFVSGNRICRFDEILITDDGEPFTAYWQSGLMGFSDPEAVKRSLRLTLSGELKGNTAEVIVRTEQREKRLALSAVSQWIPSLIDARLTMGRFHLLRVRLSDSGRARSRYDRLALYANV